MDADFHPNRTSFSHEQIVVGTWRIAAMGQSATTQGCCKLRWPNMTKLIELDYGKIYRKVLYLMVKTMVSCRFSLKPFQWMMMGFFRMVIGSLGVAKTPRLGARGLPDPVGRIQLQPQGSGILSFAKWRLRKAWCVKGRGPQFGI